ALIWAPLVWAPFWGFFWGRLCPSGGGGGGGPPEQPESAITAIYLAIAVAPPICLMMAVGMLFFYDLDEEKLKATTQEI
ncbi:MAG: hypothetical protein ACKVKT_09095, partial [Rhodospirillales bacterium]